MGIFGIFRAIAGEKKKVNKLEKIGAEELGKLSDDDLLEALSSKILMEEANLEVSECLKKFSGEKRVFYIVNYFDMEIQNGGLCQFFVNSSREVAPYILECLETIGATSYATLLSDFVTKNDISLDDLSSFITEDIDEYEEQTERYPFDDFDDAYYELYEKEPLERFLLEYVKRNLKDF